MNLEGFNEDDIVISGIGFEVPECENLADFSEKLLNGINLVTKDDKKTSPVFFEELPEYSGKIRNYKKFDNTFFGISQIVTASMDPMTRHIMERTFEALIDAGINPADIRGTNTAVYSATSFSEFDLAWFADYRGGYGIMGRNRCMNANRVSYWLDAKGTSLSMDGSYANGILNIAGAWESLKKDRCDIALVSSANLQAIPEAAIQYNDLKGLSKDGMCKSYDDSADGPNRSDAVIVYVLQKAKYAKRCYAIIADAFFKCYGTNEEVIHRPNQKYWEIMLNEFYSNTKINVNDVHYVEGQGSGVKEEDAAELNALYNVLCKNREDPLLVGSVNSNIGFTEAAAASCGILKAIICFQNGMIPKNLHFKSPNSLTSVVKDGKIKIVDENTRFPTDKLIAVNAHGIGGIYAHLVLKANPRMIKPKFDGIPRLVLLSARTDQFMDEILDEVESTPIDVEFVGLIHDIHSKHIDKYLSRGYTIVPKVKDTSIREHQVYGQEKHPVWFIFSGMGSQWTKMGKRLMDLPIFRESIEKSHKILLEKGLDLINIITTDDPKIFDNILHSFVGIAAIQVALVDILNALGIVPDMMIGHSVGELGCSYADGCLTAEQTILCAYSRGKASIETELIKGFMAAIGKGYNEIKDELPEGIEVACHNAANSCTLSGPADLVKKYVEELQSRKIFARTVNVANIAYHSQYIKPAAPKLLQYLKDVIPEPKLRSSKWISTSILEENWDTDLAKYCSAEYHTNNLLSSVYFEEGSKHIPDNAICIEIAPHGLLQAILKRSLNEKCINIPLTNRMAEDPINFLLQAVGKMYLAGLSPQIHKLYPEVQYPVSNSVPSLHQLVHWQHDHDIFVFQYASEKKTRYSLKDQFVKTARDAVGYQINDKNYYPASVFLYLIWSVFASSLKRKLNDCPVVFEQVLFERPIAVQDSETDDVEIFVATTTGKFEILKNGSIIVKGKISLLEVKEKELPKSQNADYLLLKNEIYKEFIRRGYNVGNDLRNLESLEVKGEDWKCKISHSADWIQTLESIIQLQILEQGEKTKNLLAPSTIKKIAIDPDLHLKYCNDVGKAEAEYQSALNHVKCGGIEMKGLKFEEIPEIASPLKFESIRFVPFMNPNFQDLWTYVDYCFEIVTENVGDVDINVLQITNETPVSPVASYLEKNYSHLKVTTVTEKTGIKHDVKYDFVVCDASDLSDAGLLLKPNGFAFVKSPANGAKVSGNLETVSEFSLNGEEFTLLKKKEISNMEAEYVVVPDEDKVLFTLLRHLEKFKRIPYLITSKNPEGGFQNYRKKFQKEFSTQLRWIVMLDKKAPRFDPKNQFYAKQLKKGLAVNVFSENSWGTFHRRQFVEKDGGIDSSLPKSTNNITPTYVGVEIGEDYILSNQVEYSAELENGNQIMGIATMENNKLIPDEVLKWDVPENWSLQEAATVPISYSLVYYCMKILGDIEKITESVLVIGGLSYYGQAAISCGLSLETSVYATVNDEEEKEALRKIFPSLDEDHVVIHGANYEIELGFITEGRYFDVVINCEENDKFLSSLNCIGHYGKFFHFGNKDFKKDLEIGMGVFLANTSMYIVSPDSLIPLGLKQKEKIRDFVAKSIADGYVEPLPSIVYTPHEIEKLVEDKKHNKNRLKILLNAEFFKTEDNKLTINPENSYIVFGDETGLWVDIAKWLIRRGVNKIIINCRNSDIKNSSGEIETLKNHKNVTLRHDSNVTKSLDEARKLGPVAGVFLTRMTENYGKKLFSDLDNLYRDKTGHLIVISKKSDAISNVCLARSIQGYPTTNFIWQTEKILTNQNLNFIENISGQDFEIHVSDIKKSSSSSESHTEILKQILPPTVEQFCNFGSSLNNEIKLVELPTLSQKYSEVKNISPLIVIPGLNGDLESVLAPLCKKLIYPCFAVKVSAEEKNSIQEIALKILPEITSLDKYNNTYNILGLSWGSYIAIELTRLIEEAGGTVSLMLIDGPLRPLQEAFTTNKSLENDLLKTIQEIAGKTLVDTSASGSITESVNKIVNTIQIPNEDKNNFKEAVLHIYHKLKAMLGYDYSSIKLKGPVTAFKTGHRLTDSAFLKMSNNMSVRHVDENHDKVLNSQNVLTVIHGSAITTAMSKNTINLPSWKEFEEFLYQEDLNKINNAIIYEEYSKANKEIQLFGLVWAGDRKKQDAKPEDYIIKL